MNYVTKVDRPNGLPTKVQVQANGVSLTFITGKDGKPLEVSRSRAAMVLDHSSLYVPTAHYGALVRQVAAILNQKPKSKQLGFQFNKEVQQ